MSTKDSTAAAAAKEASELVSHTAEITAAALVKFTSENAVLGANIEFIKKDLAELKEDFKTSKLRYIDINQHEELCKSNSDHETRLRLVESSTIQVKTWGAGLIVAVGILEFIIQKFVK